MTAFKTADQLLTVFTDEAFREKQAKKYVKQGAFVCPKMRELVDVEFCESFSTGVPEEHRGKDFKTGCAHCATCPAYKTGKEVEKYLN